MHSLERWIAVARVERTIAPPWLLAWWRSQARPIPLLLAAACVLAGGKGSADPSAPSPEAAIAQALSSRGLSCDASEVWWVTGPNGVWGAIAGKARALVRAHVGDEPSDLYLVEARLSPEGAVLDAGDAWNVTDTRSVDESTPAVQGHRAVYLTFAEGLCTGLHVLDLAGRRPEEGFSRVQLAQVALTNLQHTGQPQGVVHDTFALDPVAREATFSWRGDGLVEVHADDRLIVVDPAEKRVVAGDSFVRVLLDERARPGNVATWAVDRVRAMSWFGDDRMQWLKAVAFTALDRWQAEFSRGTTAQQVADELGLPETPAPTATFGDAELGWPPPPMRTVASPALPGEGRWIPLDKDPFITKNVDGTTPAFVTSFVRPDAHRLDVRVYVTLWDPRQIALHMEAGVIEPIGASGEHGPGLVPRSPEVIKHLVAGFNGGFQAQHGEYGMRANGIEYLPPKPYAATVVELRDGSNAFGAWPGPGEEAAVPGDIVAFRQNLTALVQNDKFNPWGRTWWGGTPPGWPDQVHSTRSAICLTREGFIGYFYSTSISAEDLAQGMLDARCSFGIHLDMNPGHAGFEFYNIARDDSASPLGRPLQSDWEAEGRVPDMAGYLFRARRMIRAMGHMLFPRYIQREARDFFYLTARQLLPGAPIVIGSAEPDEGVWRTKALPQHGFPYALATTWVHASPGSPPAGPKLRVLRVDPRMVKPMTKSLQEPTVLALAGGTRGTRTLFWQNAAFAIAAAPPSPDGLVSGRSPSAHATDVAILMGGVPWDSPAAATSRAAVGVQDEDGMLVWVELPPEATAGDSSAAAMEALLARLGCSERMAVPGDVRALPGGSLDVLGAPLSGQPPPVTSRLVRARGPDAHTIFESTPIVPSPVWQPLQAKRVRYFYKPPPSPSATPSGGPAPK
jgi:hypothetical protein